MNETIQNKESIATEQIKQYNPINYNKIPKPYHPIVKGIELLQKSNTNAIVIKSKNGLGKSWWVDYAVKETNANFIVFKGTISEARFFQFIQDNADKVIVMRDCGSMLRRLTFLDFLKSATDTIPIRKISRMNYSSHQGVEETIDFKGKIIWEINDIPKKNKEDLDAVINRSLFIELNLSYDDIKNIMYLICNNKFEREVTNYLLNFKNLSRNSLNLRTQNICLNIAKVAVLDRINWREHIKLFLDTQVSEIKKSFYRFAGYNKVKRVEFVKYLISEREISYVTAQTRISEALILEDLYSNSLKKQAMLSLNKF